MAELADALDLGSSGQPWGFESPFSHQDRLFRKRTAGDAPGCTPGTVSFTFIQLNPVNNAFGGMWDTSKADTIVKVRKFPVLGFRNI
jgi:hypothetical protein